MSRCERCVCSRNGKCTAPEPCLEFLIAVGRVVMRHHPLRSIQLPKRPERVFKKGLVEETLRRR
jgi:hypothetical protein